MPRSNPSRAASPHQEKTASRGGFLVGWVTITLATILVFAAFAGPLIQNGHAAAITKRLATVPMLDTSLSGVR